MTSVDGIDHKLGHHTFSSIGEDHWWGRVLLGWSCKNTLNAGVLKFDLKRSK